VTVRVRSLSLLFLFAAMLGCRVNAQVYTVTATGTTSNSETEFGVFVPIGTPATFTFTFNAATAEVVPSTGYVGPGVQTYVDPLGSATLSTGSLTLSVTSPEIRVSSDYQGTYGYEFTGFTGALDTSGGFAIQLLSGNADVAPTTSLSAIHTVPLSETTVPNISPLAAVTDTGAQDLDVQLDTFSVAVAAPEPRSLGIGVTACLVFALLKLLPRSQAARGTSLLRHGDF
jgi:hypothetical protein